MWVARADFTPTLTYVMACAHAIGAPGERLGNCLRIRANAVRSFDGERQKYRVFQRFDLLDLDRFGVDPARFGLGRAFVFSGIPS